MFDWIRHLPPVALLFLAMAMPSVIRVFAQESPSKVPQTANEDRALEARVRELIQRLGDADYARREQAAHKLLEIGYPAIGLLSEEANSTDREIRTRARRILTMIRDVDFQRRLSAFAVERDSSRSHGLPGWGLFRKTAQDDPIAREMFIEMQKAEPDLMRLAEVPAGSGRERLVVRVQQLHQNFNVYGEDCSVASLAAVICVGLHHRLFEHDLSSGMVYQLCRHEPVQTATSAGARKNIMRRLLGQWVALAPPAAIPQALMLSQDYHLPEGLKLAEQTVRDKHPNPFVRFYTVLVIIEFGDEQHVSILESLLSDAAAPLDFQLRRGQPPVQIRDVALLAILQLLKLDPSDFSFKKATGDAPAAITSQPWYFESEEKREEGIHRWKLHRARSQVKPNG